MIPIQFQPSSPAKAGDPLLRRQQALAWAKASVARDGAPDADQRAPAVPVDTAADGKLPGKAQLQL
jgi:hypothetical protein